MTRGKKAAEPKLHDSWPAAKIEMVPVADVIPYARNSRDHSAEQVDRLAASMKEFGWTNPIIIDEENVLIAGHGRIMAAQKLGWTDAPAMRATGWTEEKKKAYRIADNKLALLAEWDEEMLELEIAELQKMDYDLDLTGFSDQEITDLLTPAELEPPDDFDEHDENIETQHECPRCSFRF